jgi:hypothetical protein
MHVDPTLLTAVAALLTSLSGHLVDPTTSMTERGRLLADCSRDGDSG